MEIIALGDGVYHIPLDAVVVGFDAEASFHHDNEEETLFVVYYEKQVISEITANYKKIEMKADEFLLEKFPLSFRDCEKVWVGEAYETHWIMFSSVEPKPLNHQGSGFNYGSCNQITVNEPGYVWVLAEND